MDLVKRGTQSGYGNVEANKAKRTPSEDEVLKREREMPWREGGCMGSSSFEALPSCLLVFHKKVVFNII
jgi:hypothetical protein